MKKFYFLAMILIVGMGVSAQSFKSNVPKSKQMITVPAPLIIDNANIPIYEANPLTAVKSTSEAAIVIGTTRYDAQCNGSMHERIWGLYDEINNKEYIAGIWTRGMNDVSTYPDRGTGYNYFDGTSWGLQPTSRIETVRTGWPAYQPWNGGGEIVISHVGTGTSGLIMNTRPVRGTGAWTQSTMPVPSGATGCIWPTMITSGPTHNYIHILTISTPVGVGGVVYQGLDGALLYYRSTDGGVTWDKLGLIIDPMNSTNYTGFSGDEYAWGSPHGDTICFVVGGNWTNTFLMKSYDNGETWDYTEILSNAHKTEDASVYAAPFYCCDNSSAVEIDKEGTFHVVFGRMCALDYGSTRYYRPYTEGLIYWNSNMPPIQDSLIMDTLAAHGQLLGYVYSDAAGDSVEGIPYYGVGMTSYPQITIDKDDHIFVIWSGVTVGNPYVGGSSNLNYRHIWERHSWDHGTTWSDSNDFNHGLAYIYREYVFCAMVKEKIDTKIRFLYQSADIPGSTIEDAGTTAVHDNTIEQRNEPIVPVGISDNTRTTGNTVSQNMPNPFQGTTTVDVNLVKPASLSLEVYDMMGQKIITLNKGNVHSGAHEFTIDGSQLTTGIYLYMVKMGNETISHKMLID